MAEDDIYDGPLIPGCGGTEKPFTINGRRWLYCYHPSSKRHCYLDLDNDRAVWNRHFHPAFHPELEFEPEIEPVFYPRFVPQASELCIADESEIEDFFF